MTSMTAANALVELQQVLYESKNPTRRWLHTVRKEWIIDALRRCARRRHARALEVGPGSGIYLPVLSHLYDEVTAIDIEDAYLNHANALTAKHPNLRLQVDDITDSSLPGSSFDLVLCTEVIEHIRDSAAAIAQMHRLLAPGGTLILSTPQRYSTLELATRIAFLPGIVGLVRRIYREPILEPGHVNSKTGRQIVRQLEDAGFRIRQRHSSGMYVPLLAEFLGETGLWLERWLELKLRGGRLNGLLWTQYYVAQGAKDGAGVDRDPKDGLLPVRCRHETVDCGAGIQ
ncbi:MAG: methyltransferase domain-containing protein [Phycisphaerales bacterium]|nr:MAG: methyltransferase domain-containing protein [Phycisphaerales bacterium]